MRKRLRWICSLGALLALAGAGSASAAVTSISIDPTAQLSPGRQAVALSGSITCSQAEFVSLQGQLLQGQTRAAGTFGGSVMCGTSPTSWTTSVFSSSRLWHPGRASAGVLAFTFTSPVVGTDRFVQIVR